MSTHLGGSVSDSYGSVVSLCQWAAQFLAAGELVRHGYDIAFTMGNTTPVADLMVGYPRTGGQFWVDVKGGRNRNEWGAKHKQTRENLFYILVSVGSDRKQDRFFALDQTEYNGLIERYDRSHPKARRKGIGFRFQDAEPFEGNWNKLPDWDALVEPSK